MCTSVYKIYTARFCCPRLERGAKERRGFYTTYRRGIRQNSSRKTFRKGWERWWRSRHDCQCSPGPDGKAASELASGWTSTLWPTSTFPESSHILQVVYPRSLPPCASPSPITPQLNLPYDPLLCWKTCLFSSVPESPPIPKTRFAMRPVSLLAVIFLSDLGVTYHAFTVPGALTPALSRTMKWPSTV